MDDPTTRELLDALDNLDSTSRLGVVIASALVERQASREELANDTQRHLRRVFVALAAMMRAHELHEREVFAAAWEFSTPVTLEDWDREIADALRRFDEAS